MAPIQNVAPKINEMAPKINKMAPKINKMVPKINKMAPIQTWPQKLIKWQQFKMWPKKSIKWHQKLINGTNLMSVSVQPIAAQDIQGQPNTAFGAKFELVPSY